MIIYIFRIPFFKWKCTLAMNIKLFNVNIFNHEWQRDVIFRTWYQSHFEKIVDKSKSQIKVLNEQYWKRLTMMTFALEFKSEKINRLRKQNMDWIMIKNFLKKLRPTKFYDISEKMLTPSIAKICAIIDQVAPQLLIKSTAHEMPNSNINVSVEYRCGRPHEKSHRYSRRKFFMKNTYDSSFAAFHFRINRNIFKILFEFHSFLTWKLLETFRKKINSSKVIKKVRKRFVWLSRSFIPSMKKFEKIPFFIWNNEGFSDNTSFQRMKQDLSSINSTFSVMMNNQSNVIQITVHDDSTFQLIALSISVEMKNLSNIVIRTSLFKSRRKKKNKKKTKSKKKIKTKK